MFGTVRTLWALMVVFGHLFWLSDFGRFAVFGFYILSGYLMTYVMQQRYGYQASGKKRFALNRFLRLYPGYWFSCLLSLLLLLAFNRYFPLAGFSTIAIPSNAASLLGNFTMVYPSWLPHSITPRLSPAAWALTVEIFFYCAICLGISKTLQRSLIWLALSVLYVVASYIGDLYWHARYFSIPAGSLPFSIGAVIYFVVQQNKVPISWQVILKKPALILLVMVTISGFTAWQINQGLHLITAEILFYTNMLISAMLVLSLALGHSLHNKISAGFDKFIGDFSYPIYLLHYQASIIASLLLLGEASKFKQHFSSAALLLVGLIVVVLSLLVIKCIDLPVERLRKSIRDKASGQYKAAS
ncbi:acyltransferase [Agarivorans sp. OAG1]|uniref:acyltransferase family protein n=1 Tax=Agarivorans sp. OAG1 TaxID=3082387 RepID=UPI002B2921C8|nr:acyltransferase [Agarivorans sp. OAG1]